MKNARSENNTHASKCVFFRYVLPVLSNLADVFQFHGHPLNSDCSLSNFWNIEKALIVLQSLTPQQTNAKYGYFLDQDIGEFDAGFFNISGVEAEAMDPQQRILLEVVYEALEDGKQSVLGTPVRSA